MPVAIVLLAIIGVFMITAPNSFQSPRIYLSFLATVPPPLIVGLGLTLVIAAGEIDLSFPSVIKMSGVVFAMLCKFVAFPLDPQAAGGLAPDLLIWLFAFLAVLVGAAIGFFNGVLVAIIGIPSIIATLCSLFIFEGLSLIIGNGLQFSIRGIDSYSLLHVLSGRWFGMPAQAVWGLVVAVVIWLLLNRHRFGEHLLFIGDNQDVARVLGVNVRREKLKLFTLMGALAGLRQHPGHAGEPQLLHHPGHQLPADRHGGRVHRRHLDLRRQGQRRRHAVRLLHRRLHGGRRRRQRAQRLLDPAGGRAWCSWRR